ncbi:MAG: polysaccharide deacetylase family protein [Clostridiales Family XIII bacterium]|jgi:peptidoglycan/xylan/chitin deacetylase (PgdA/CDA1 family)|nr:polysaccharide deacetylase family protein [Clostridiales Family XIII bacterium]
MNIITSPEDSKNDSNINNSEKKDSEPIINNTDHNNKINKRKMKRHRKAIRRRNQSLVVRILYGILRVLLIIIMVVILETMLLGVLDHEGLVTVHLNKISVFNEREISTVQDLVHYVRNGFKNDQPERTTATKTEEEEAPVEDNINTITFDAGGGSIESSSGLYEVVGDKLDLEIGSQIRNLPIAHRDNLCFIGWYEMPQSEEDIANASNDGTSGDYEDSEVQAVDLEAGRILSIDDGYPLNDDKTLYAHYKPAMDVTTKPAISLYNRRIDKTASPLPILMYHQFYDKSIGEKSVDSNCLSVALFEDHIRYLKENGYYYPTWKEVYAYDQGQMSLPVKSIVITDDDAGESFFRLAYPVLERYNVPATSFVIGEAIMDPNHPNHDLSPFSRNILTYESHSYGMHKGGVGGKGMILSATDEFIANDVASMNAIIGSNYAFCYPFGHYDEDSELLLRNLGVQLGVTVDYGKVLPGYDPMALPRVRINEGDQVGTFASEIGGPAPNLTNDATTEEDTDSDY